MKRWRESLKKIAKINLMTIQMKNLFLQDFTIIYWKVTYSLTVAELDKTYTEYVAHPDNLLLTDTMDKNKILLIIVLDAYFQDFDDIAKMQYKETREDFKEYLLATINRDILREDNIFAKINKNWYNHDMDASEIFELKQQWIKTGYMLEDTDINSILYQPVTLTTEVRKYIDEFVQKFQQFYTNKVFFHMVLPHNIPYKYLVTGNFDKEYSVIYYELNGLKRMRTKNAQTETEIEDNYIYSLEKLIKINFSIYGKKILIIFVFDGYYCYHSHFNEDATGLGDYGIYIDQLSQYMNNVIYNAEAVRYFKPLYALNYFGNINETWYYNPTSEYENSEYWQIISNVTKKGRKLIDDYIKKLKKQEPEKIFAYIVLPKNNNQYRYLIL